jgi:hypothetical protein|tara:strand:+ start:922 stop:1500 length:579 start_codon:yes stop_codon:yes gene_type:complete
MNEIDKKLYNEFGRDVYRNKWDKDGKEAKAGYRAEDLFAASALKYYPDLKPSTEEENIKDHIDFKCEGLGTVDVKAKKQSFDEGLIWIELKNVIGEDGWLFGNQDRIAFEWNDHFRIVRRDWLHTRVGDLLDKAKPVKHKSRALYNYYDRSQYGNKDLLTQITTQDVYFVTESTIDFATEQEVTQYRESTFG